MFKNGYTFVLGSIPSCPGPHAGTGCGLDNLAVKAGSSAQRRSVRVFRQPGQTWGQRSRSPTPASMAVVGLASQAHTTEAIFTLLTGFVLQVLCVHIYVQVSPCPPDGHCLTYVYPSN